ncbi:MAG: long-chain fatty acid--CoA ligase [Pseudomonadota bacterium]
MRILPEENWTLTDLFLERVRLSPEGKAYRWFDGTAWMDMSWGEAATEVGRWQAALAKENLKPGDRVGLCSRNRVEWMCFDQAALGLGLVVVPLFYNDRPDNMAYCLTDAGAKLLLLEDGKLWEALRTQVNTLERVVCLNDAPKTDAKAVSAKQWLPKKGVALQPSPTKAGELATLVYTSGTTGRPKGVMLSHRNIVSDLRAVIEAVPEICGQPQRFLSFLPLSHMFERTAGYYVPMCMDANAQVIYARGILELGEDMVSQKPTIIVSVPRIFERVYSKVEENLPPGSTKRKLFEKTVDIGWKRFKKEASLGENLLWPVLNTLVAKKLRARLGGELEYIFLGGAALAPHLLKIFTGVGFTFVHGYGLTETSPIATCNRMADNDPMSVGHPVPGVEVRMAGNGELHIRGPIVMLGYWNNQAATDAVLDKDGWFHTGDIVEMREGRIYIRGRMKDVIILSNGEKIPPGDAEQAIVRDTAFDQVMVVGEGRSHLGLLVVSKLEDERELCQRANAQLKDFPGYAKIRHLARVSEPWTVENGLITPTLKLKRNKIEERYAKEIEAMYKRSDLCGPA